MASLEAALVVATLALASCRDNEQRARAVGADARSSAAASCATNAGGDDRALELDACIDGRCRTACAGHDVASGFASKCVESCRDSGTCNTSADCGAGKDCIAIAPVVRRCQSVASPTSR